MLYILPLMILSFRSLRYLSLYSILIRSAMIQRLNCYYMLRVLLRYLAKNPWPLYYSIINSIWYIIIIKDRRSKLR
jgi:hypothetical protein